MGGVARGGAGHEGRPAEPSADPARTPQRCGGEMGGAADGGVLAGRRRGAPGALHGTQQGLTWGPHCHRDPGEGEVSHFLTLPLPQGGDEQTLKGPQAQGFRGWRVTSEAQGQVRRPHE